MGASESLPARQPPQQQRPQWADEITTVSDGRRDAANEDPLLRRIRSLTIAPPLLSGQPAAGSETETSFTDILVRKPSGSSSAASGNLSPNLMFELFAMYREWQEEMAKEISGRQGELENKIETADALAVKLLQRFNYSVSSMRSTSHNLAEVHPLQVEVGELKGRLTEVISNCDALCKRITAEGPESLRTSVEPFTTGILGTGGGSPGPKEQP
ncbi:hypothetical protein CFC21_053335 [Triticum aestivum]|uniref:Uncharacterized protein n=3 Tax=Triticum TaxID=4564 RepID=A0A9R0SHB7_TRITD|nr:uncharacterized protein LOC119286806 [Triticum dicoccoides]XP_044360614.1 uncharacterized protein LOC123082325 [Triticum aestivum]KAF7044056.1 hypothetical protein CFC21_053335 [Triticum aestivum]VAH94784.1 unnamed protein product [Triticum turgidum subsp. durum]